MGSRFPPRHLDDAFALNGAGRGSGEGPAADASNWSGRTDSAGALGGRPGEPGLFALDAGDVTVISQALIAKLSGLRETAIALRDGIDPDDPRMQSHRLTLEAFIRDVDRLIRPGDRIAS